MHQQSTDTVLLVRPAAFGHNAETAATNAFQARDVAAEGIAAAARAEAEGLARVLGAAGVRAALAEDEADPPRPDAVFPNNWFSTHEDGTLVIYPMCARNRRLERRLEVIESVLRERGLRCERLLDLTHHESAERYLEGTGSLVLDRIGRIAYACISPRTDAGLVEEWCGELGYDPVLFRATDRSGLPIYHTNVMLAVGTGWAVWAPATIRDAADRSRVAEALASGGRTLVDIDEEQMSRYAGNVLELRTADRRLILASRSAYAALSAEQRASLNRHGDFVVADIPTIERVGGGSARCMVAELFLPGRT